MRRWSARALLSFVCIVAANSSCGHFGPWKVPAAVGDGSGGAAQVEVVLDSFDGFSDDAEAEKAREAVAIMQRVLSSEEFRCRVLSFDASMPPSAENPGTGCAGDPARRQPDGNEVGFFWGTPAGSQAALEDYGKPASNKGVYARIPRVVHLSTVLRLSAFHFASIGRTDNGVIRTNTRWFARASLAELVGHWTHEYMHVLGFRHEEASTEGRPGSVPYAVGLFACQIAQAAGTSSNPLATSQDTCIATMQGL